MINSPLNYSGNKAKVVDQILKHFPENITKITEIFAGSAIISLNSNIKNIVLNDNQKTTIQLLKYFNQNSGEKIIQDIDQIITNYKFTDSYRKGRKHYPEKKHEGLSIYNKEAFQKLKQDYNNNPTTEKLFALNIFGFNHYLRFNTKGEFNVPVGKVDYTESLRKKTIEYAEVMKQKNLEFYNYDFRNPKLYEGATENDLFYFDPPYLITDAPYNASWRETDELDLLQILDKLNSQNIRFALSNVLKSNGKENIILKEWATKYHIHYIHRQYRNANYRRKNKSEAEEVLITNF